MKEKLFLIIKGMLIGLGKILPGVSGGMIAISLGIYEKGVDAICHLFNKKNIQFLLLVGSGITLSIIFMSKFILFLLNNCYFLIMLLFIGLIIGGIPCLHKKICDEKSIINMIIMLIPIILLLFINFTNESVNIIKDSNPNFLIIIFLGMIETITMIIPGISGTAISMMLGSYEFIMNTFSNLGNINLIVENINILIPFIFGMVLSLIILIKLINYLLNNHKIKSYYAIYGFSIATIIILFSKTIGKYSSLREYILGIILLFIGFFIGYKLDIENQ